MRVVSVTRPTDGKCVDIAFAGVDTYLSDWEDSAQRAMQAEPLYFARWYTVKSIALVGVSCALIYVLMRKK